MKLFYFIMLPCAALFAISCGPSSRVFSSSGYPPLPEATEVIVLEAHEQAPQTAIQVGQIMIGDTGFSMNCSYPVVISRAKEKSLALGGNLIKITKHKTPDLLSTCHRIWADIYLLSDENLADFQAATEPEIDQTLFEEGCAILYFYRNKNFQGSAINYNVKIGDEVVWRAKNNDKEWIKVKVEGPVIISAKTESEQKLELDIKPGYRYYIRCDVSMGVMIGRPVLELVDTGTGAYEFEQINK